MPSGSCEGSGSSSSSSFAGWTLSLMTVHASRRVWMSCLRVTKVLRVRLVSLSACFLVALVIFLARNLRCGGGWVRASSASSASSAVTHCLSALLMAEGVVWVRAIFPSRQIGR